MRKVSVTAAVLLLVSLAGVFAYRARVRPTSTAPSSPQLVERVQPVSADEQVALARGACGGQVRVDGKHVITCSVCPASSDFAGAEGMPGNSTGWTFDSVLYGHFTAADADEALMRASGCESHAKGFGGDFILRNDAGKWTPVRYASGATATDKCQKIRWLQNRDAVICQTGDMHAGIVSDAVQFLLFDATQPPDDDFSNTTFMAVTDESANCGFESNPGTKRHLLQLGQIDGVRLAPPTAAGQDIAVQATITRVLSPKSEGSDCPTGEPRTYRVVFHAAGDHFEAGDEYAAVAALRREDCCEVMINKSVRVGRY